MILPKVAAIRVGGNLLTDHNRSDISVTYERIEKRDRMANGTMRRYFIADKRTFAVSWTDVPHNSTFTVDHKWAVDEIENYYELALGAIPMILTYTGGNTETFSVMFVSFAKTLKKRGRYNMYDMSASFEEI